MKHNKCIAIVGPTASGKSGLALALAKEFGGSILSCDSMQIYRKMDIGTAKPTDAEMRQVPHKLIDICDISEPFSAYDYKRAAEAEIEATLAESRIPFLVGGTGLYFDALIRNTAFGEMEIDPKIHESLTERSERGQNAALLSELGLIDPETAKKLHEKDSKRIVRALEVFYSTGKTLSEYKKESHSTPPKFDFLILYLVYRDRQALYDRINSRVDQMMQQGLFEETKKLDEMGFFSSKTAAQAIGYKELLGTLHQNIPLDESVELLKRRTRNYAKRQITWFNRYDSARIVMDAESSPLDSCRGMIREFLK